MKMTTEEAFVKVLQMHGIEHAFGIIGSAMMPISDLFPAAGIKFWDCAHECNAGMSADGYTRATGKMSMAIAQNGHREILRLRGCIVDLLASYTGKSPEEINDDADRDFVLTADEAVEYGIVDQVIAEHSGKPRE